MWSQCIQELLQASYPKGSQGGAEFHRVQVGGESLNGSIGALLEKCLANSTRSDAL